MRDFMFWLETVVDRARVVPHQFFVDVGKEVCPSPHGTATTAQVLLWRRCCLQEFMMWMYDNAPRATDDRLVPTWGYEDHGSPGFGGVNDSSLLFVY